MSLTSSSEPNFSPETYRYCFGLPQIKEKYNILNEKEKSGPLEPDYDNNGSYKPDLNSDSSLSRTSNLHKGELDMSNGFIKLSRDLKDHASYKNSPPAYRIVLLEILFRATWKKTTQDHKGKLFEIEEGQLWVSLRQLAEWCGRDVSKNDVDRAISRFSLVGFVRREVRHSKMLITVTMTDLWSNRNEESETDSETEVRQLWDTKEEYKEIKEESKKKIKKEKTHLQENLDFCFEYQEKNFIKMSKKSYEKLVAEHGEQTVKSALEEITDHFLANKKKMSEDWAATTRNWLRRQKKWDNKNSSPLADWKKRKQDDLEFIGMLRNEFKGEGIRSSTRSVVTFEDRVEFSMNPERPDIKEIYKVGDVNFRQSIVDKLKSWGITTEGL